MSSIYNKELLVVYDYHIRLFRFEDLAEVLTPPEKSAKVNFPYRAGTKVFTGSRHRACKNFPPIIRATTDKKIAFRKVKCGSEHSQQSGLLSLKSG